jgi:hypothetical protein
VFFWYPSSERLRNLRNHVLVFDGAAASGFDSSPYGAAGTFPSQAGRSGLSREPMPRTIRRTSEEDEHDKPNACHFHRARQPKECATD